MNGINHSHGWGKNSAQLKLFSIDYSRTELNAAFLNTEIRVAGSEAAGLAIEDGACSDFTGKQAKIIASENAGPEVNIYPESMNVGLMRQGRNGEPRPR